MFLYLRLSLVAYYRLIDQNITNVYLYINIVKPRFHYAPIISPIILGFRFLLTA